MFEYIERDAAFDAVFGQFCASSDETEAALNSAVEDIKRIPAADVRPVVRGRWIGNKRHQSCSECHITYCVPDGQDGELDMTAYHFCPNCGAKMGES